MVLNWPRVALVPWIPPIAPKKFSFQSTSSSPCPSLACPILPLDLIGQVQLLPGPQGAPFCSLLISNVPVLFCGSSRPLEQTESKVVYSELERPEPSSASDKQNWATQENRVQVGKTDANMGTISPTAHGEAGMKTLTSWERSLGDQPSVLLKARGKKGRDSESDSPVESGLPLLPGPSPVPSY